MPSDIPSPLLTVASFLIPERALGLDPKGSYYKSTISAPSQPCSELPHGKNTFLVWLSVPRCTAVVYGGTTVCQSPLRHSEPVWLLVEHTCPVTPLICLLLWTLAPPLRPHCPPIPHPCLTTPTPASPPDSAGKVLF